MIFTGAIVARIAVMVLAGVLVQVAALSQVVLFGVQPDVVPAIVISLGILAGSVPGAVIGFATGLLVDTALLLPLGVSSLTLLSVGYLAGRYREQYEISSAITPPLLAGGLTLVAVIGFSVLQLLLGVEAPISGLIVRDVLVKSLLNVLFAIPIYVMMRRLLRPAMMDETTPRRRAVRARSVGAR